MFKSLILTTASIFLLAACTASEYNIHKNLVNFESNKVYTFDHCANFSYKSKIDSPNYGKLFKEYISLDMSCSWSGFERGYFTDLFRSDLKIKSMKNVETLDYQNYEITTYLINNNSYINFIYYFIGSESQFIIDYNGKLSDEIAKRFDPNYKNKFLDKKRFEDDFNSSLVEKNIIKHYFNRNNESSFDKSN